MFRNRGTLLIVISILLAVAAAWLANRWVQARAMPATAQPGTVSVVTAAMDIPFSTKVEKRHLAVIQMLPGTAPAGTFSDIAQVDGKVSQASLLAGEILLHGRFAEQGNGSTLAAV